MLQKSEAGGEEGCHARHTNQQTPHQTHQHQTHQAPTIAAAPVVVAVQSYWTVKGETKYKQEGKVTRKNKTTDNNNHRKKQQQY